MVETTIEKTNLGNIEVLAKKYSTENLLASHQAFKTFVYSTLPVDAKPLESIGAIQESATLFNQEALDSRKIDLFFHFTDNNGAQEIADKNTLGFDNSKTYLTKLTPDIAKSLASKEDSIGFQKYFKDRIMPQSLKEHIERFVLAMKFKWRHDVLKNIFKQPIVPVGEHKLENVILLACSKENNPLKKDEMGEVYIERKINTHNDPEFSVFGPFKCN